MPHQLKCLCLKWWSITSCLVDLLSHTMELRELRLPQCQSSFTLSHVEKSIYDLNDMLAARGQLVTVHVGKSLTQIMLQSPDASIV